MLVLKDRIIKAALKLFSKKGYHATTVQEIANCAEISKSTLYSNFTSKKDILSSIYHFYLDSLYQQLNVDFIKEENFDSYVRDLRKWNVVAKLVKHGFPCDKVRLSEICDMSDAENVASLLIRSLETQAFIV